jgi:type-F conjugative transfer system pilin assembly protein TrbC
MEKNELLYRLKKIRNSSIRVVWPLLMVGICFVLYLSYANAASIKDIVRESQQQVEDHKHIYKPLVEKNKKEVSKLESEHRQIIKQAEQAFKDHANNIEAEKGSILDEVINNIKNLDLEEKKGKNKGILIFVSFSMPKSLLWSYQEQAKLYGARVVIRGLVDNDFKKTVQAMDLGDGKIMTLDVNPMLFKDYDITKVPSVIIAGDAESRQVEDKFTGTISLTYALEESISRGHQKEFSRKTLKLIKEGGSK